MMQASAKAIELIKRFEGCRLTAYLCPAGKPTWGWGHTGPDVKIGESITQARADELLAQDAARFSSGIDAWVDADITQAQFDACVCFSFNVGLAAFRSSTLLRKIEARQDRAAADEFLRWNKAKVNGVMVALPGLTKRRQAERELFLS